MPSPSERAKALMAAPCQVNSYGPTKNTCPNCLEAEIRAVYEECAQVAENYTFRTRGGRNEYKPGCTVDIAREIRALAEETENAESE